MTALLTLRSPLSTDFGALALFRRVFPVTAFHPLLKFKLGHYLVGALLWRPGENQNIHAFGAAPQERARRRIDG